jgi:kynurenine formamidase
MNTFDLSTSEFQALYERLKRQSIQGSADRRGALNNISTSDVVAAASDVWVGRTISLGAPVESQSAAGDRVAMDIHGNAESHIDALCHVIFDGMLYNDIPAQAVTATGAIELSIEVVGDGIVGRGLLLDIPRVRDVPWLEPGDHVTADDLAAAEEAQDVHIGQGDLLFVRVGHRRRRSELGPWDAAQARAGLHPTALELLADRQIAVLGSDGDNDTVASAVEGVDFPVHVLAINAMGLHLLDYLHLEDLVAFCDHLRRWSFLCVIAPLRLRAGTGSPVNPIAIF